MSHPLFTTDGIILSKRAVGEASTLAIVFTKELGLLQARAQSARLERSKLRYGLEPFTEARYTLVRGKYEWKLVNGFAPSRSRADLLAADVLARRAAGNIANLLIRLIRGEESAPILYGDVAGGLSLLFDHKSRKHIDALEQLIVSRILHRLGYLPQIPDLTSFTSDEPLSLNMAERALRARPLLIAHINHSLSVTGL